MKIFLMFTNFFPSVVQTPGTSYSAIQRGQFMHIKYIYIYLGAVHDGVFVLD